MVLTGNALIGWELPISKTEKVYILNEGNHRLCVNLDSKEVNIT
jgi:hypothetical protein